MCEKKNPFRSSIFNEKKPTNIEIKNEILCKVNIAHINI